MPDRIATLAPFKNQTFRTIWIASLASNFGGLIQAVGAAWMMTSISNSQDMVALVQSSTTLPIMMFSLIAGALADNFNRRSIMLTAQLFMLAVSIALTIFAYLDLLTPWLLLCFTFLLGCGVALNNPAWQASVGDIVSREMLPQAVTLNSVGFNITRSVGPAIGGAVVAAAGAAAAFALNAASYVALMYALLRWKPERRDDALPRETLLRALSAGLGYVSMSPNILNVLLRGMLFGFSASAILALLPIVARDLVSGGPLTYGIMLGCFGVGAIGGAMSNARLREKLTSERIVQFAFLGFAASSSVIALSTNTALTALVLIVPGACWVLALSLFNTTVQLSAPRWVVGRALSFYQTTTFGGMAVGSWIWGVGAENLGVSVSLSLASLAMLVGGLAGLRNPLPQFTDVDLSPLNKFNEPMLRLDLQPRSGPIVLQIDYEIAEQDIPEFLTLMARRRRVRIRDGARQWALMRDLEHPEIWTETYHTATWADYVRHNRRRLQIDEEIWDAIRKLHRGVEGPRVHRMIERQTIPPKDDIFHKHHVDLH
ncbi:MULTISPECIES: MFS transporter [Rhizobium]|uniref:MFS family permease n=1 Tax=Rhizobium wenxiniae TaxID=1737357 RepID=A0A7X0D0C3_9HYPH|nr:MFS transporter [Rhizobium wenxiniae]MBB6163224.1 MFS family permease [Rhizobium wenxiniae]GGF92513.1 MFS transporter [Rhizobium wenxiniae]